MNTEINKNNKINDFKIKLLKDFEKFKIILDPNSNEQKKLKYSNRDKRKKLKYSNNEDKSIKQLQPGPVGFSPYYPRRKEEGGKLKIK